MKIDNIKEMELISNIRDFLDEKNFLFIRYGSEVPITHHIEDFIMGVKALVRDYEKDIKKQKKKKPKTRKERP